MCPGIVSVSEFGHQVPHTGQIKDTFEQCRMPANGELRNAERILGPSKGVAITRLPFCAGWPDAVTAVSVVRDEFQSQ